MHVLILSYNLFLYTSVIHFIFFAIFMVRYEHIHGLSAVIDCKSAVICVDITQHIYCSTLVPTLPLIWALILLLTTQLCRCFLIIYYFIILHHIRTSKSVTHTRYKSDN